MTVFYLPIEPYPDRYSWQLKGWTEDAFKRRKVTYVTILGNQKKNYNTIKTGSVLDAHARSKWALQQTTDLIGILSSGTTSNQDSIYIEDMFHPGYEAIPYCLYQMSEFSRPKVYVRCHAQSIDPDDFTHTWRNWMRPYEQMVDRTCNGIFMNASEMVPWMRVGGLEAPCYITGMPFDSNEIRSRVKSIPEHKDRSYQVIYSSRFDIEKQPHFFLDLVEKMNNENADIDFVIATGGATLRGEPSAIDRANQLLIDNKLKISVNLTKEQYYDLLVNSRAHINTGRQDWISVTLLEASALGTPSLCPAFRSFPEALNNNEKQMFVPWSLDDCAIKLLDLVDNGCDNVEYASKIHDDSMNRTIDVLLGLPEGEKCRWIGPSTKPIWE
jgi:glycosyltransferase involved in cell wall biosynthesis